MSICPNAYYNYRKNRKAGYRQRKEKLKEKILQIYHEYSGNPEYRMMRVYLLRAKISLSNTTVLKYMQELGIKSTVAPKKPAYKKGTAIKSLKIILTGNSMQKSQMRNGVRIYLYFYGRWKETL